METRENMIAEIYEKMADKTLLFGCKIEFLNCGHNNIYQEGIYIDNIFVFNFDEIIKRSDIGQDYLYCDGFDESNIKIIGHPVMATDILHYCKENGINCALSCEGKMIGNKNTEGSYFEIQFDDIRKPIEDNPSAIEGMKYFNEI